METTVTRDDAQTDEAQILAMTDARVRAIRAKDVESLMSVYDDRVATFDMVSPLANLGAAAVRRRVSTWLASFETKIDYSIHEVRVSVSGDVAFDHHLTHVSGVSKAGGPVDMWFRESMGYSKSGGAWKVTHQHSSVPFDMRSGKAELALEPERVAAS